MPSILRSRLALFALLGAFLIPIGMSSLRGLTHVLTCREQVRTPFTLVIPESGTAEAVTSTRITRDEAKICGGLALDLGTRLQSPRRLAMVVPITNESPYLWRGTVQLILDGTAIPVDIGRVPAGETASDTVAFDLETGSHEVSGSLLIGP
ncbi:MAG: hypothetical protein ABR529_07685 [Actinomycetota bacterium]